MNEPTEEQIAAWKEEHENVFEIDSGRGVYYFRSIGFKEYEKAIEIDQKHGSIEADDYLVSVALLHPEPTEENLAKMPAFFASTLSDYILDFSCLGDAENAIKKMQEERERVQSTKGVMMTFILVAFPDQYTIDDLEDESFFSLARKVAFAEQVIQLKQAVSSGSQIEFQLADSNKEETPEPPRPVDKNEEVLAKLRRDMDKAMSYVSSGQNVEYEG